MAAEVPIENMRFSACAKTPSGIIVFDTCPSKEVYDAFFASPEARALMERHGLDAPVSVVDHPVVAAYAQGTRLDA